MTDGISGLQNLVKNTAIDDSDKSVTKQDAKKFVQNKVDVNNDGKIDDFEKKAGDLDELREMASVDLGGYRGPDRDALIRAQISLKQALKELKPKEAPGILNRPGLYNAEKSNLFKNPYCLTKDGTESPENKIWSDMRRLAEGKTLKLNTNRAYKLVDDAKNSKQSGETDMQAIVRGLWENDDYTPDGARKRIFRMEEIKGALDYINQNSLDKENFFKEMGSYIQKEFGEEAQFTLDSLLAVSQSTDWSGDGKTTELRNFIGELGIGIAKNVSLFVDKEAGDDGVVIGNYNGDLLNENFGSLLLIKYKDKDGNLQYEFIQYETASPLNKTKYVFDDSAIDTNNTIKDLEDMQKGISDLVKGLQSSQAQRAQDPRVAPPPQSISQQIDQIGQQLGELRQEIEGGQKPTQAPETQSPSPQQSTKPQGPGIVAPGAPSIGSTPNDLNAVVAKLGDIQKSIGELIALLRSGNLKDPTILEQVIKKLESIEKALEQVADQLEKQGRLKEALQLHKYADKIEDISKELTKPSPSGTPAAPPVQPPAQPKAEEKPALPKTDEAKTSKRPPTLASVKEDEKSSGAKETSKSGTARIEIHKPEETRIDFSSGIEVKGTRQEGSNETVFISNEGKIFRIALKDIGGTNYYYSIDDRLEEKSYFLARKGKVHFLIPKS